MAEDIVLQVCGLSKSLDGIEALCDVSLELRRGDFCGLVGPNGSGKTTLLRCVTGQLTVDAQCVTVLGKDLHSQGFDAKTLIGYAFEPKDLPPELTGLQLLKFVSSLRSVPQFAEEVSELAAMFEMEGKLTDQVITYSNGMKQKLGVMLALIGTPPLLVMDESLNGLDPVSAYRLKCHLAKLAEQKQATILLSSHLLDSLERYCTRVVMIREGRLEHEWTRASLEAEMASTGRHLEEIFVERLLREVRASGLS